MYIKVLIGEYKRIEGDKEVVHESSEIIVNPDCPIRIIYDFIQQSFDIDCDLEFDLCDENGNLANIYDKEPWVNGKNYLAPKTTYFVVFFERDEEGRIINPVLHLHESFRKSNGQLNELMNKIRKQLNISSSSKIGRMSRSRSVSVTYVK